MATLQGYHPVYSANENNHLNDSGGPNLGTTSNTGCGMNVAEQSQQPTDASSTVSSMAQLMNAASMDLPSNLNRNSSYGVLSIATPGSTASVHDSYASSLSSDGFPVKKRRLKNPGPPIRPQCTECGKDFSNQSALSKHKLTHSDERRFVCSLCQKAFKRQDHLNGHMLTHRDKKPFECDVEGCEKTYCDARSLRRHKENHHAALNSLQTNPANPQYNFALVSRSILSRIQYAPAQPQANGVSPINLGISNKSGSSPFSASAATHLQLLALSQQQGNHLFSGKNLSNLQPDQQARLSPSNQLQESQHFGNDSLDDKDNQSVKTESEDHGYSSNNSSLRRASNDPQNLLHQLLTQQLREPSLDAAHLQSQLASLASCPPLATENCNISANGWSTLEQMSKMLDPMRLDPLNQVECNICQRRFKNLPALNGHMRLHGGYMKNSPVANNMSIPAMPNQANQPQPPAQQQSHSVMHGHQTQSHMEKKKDDITNDMEAKAIIEAIKEKIKQKHATSANFNNEISCKDVDVDSCRTKSCSPSDLIGKELTYTSCQSILTEKSNGNAKTTDNEAVVSHPHSSRPRPPPSQSSCFSFQEPSPFATPSSSVDRKLSPIIHGQSENEITADQSTISLSTGNELHANQDGNNQVDSSSNVTSFDPSHSHHQNQDLGNLLPEKETLKDDSNSEDNMDSNWYSNIATLREQLQQHFYAPNDISTSSVHSNHRSQYSLSGEKSRRHSDSTAEMVFSNHHYSGKTSRVWSEQNHITEDSSSLFSNVNIPELKRRNQRAISDPGNGEMDDQQAQSTADRSHHTEASTCPQMSGNHTLSSNMLTSGVTEVNKLYHQNHQHHRQQTHQNSHHTLSHHPQHHSYSYGHSIHSHSVPTTPTNLNPLLPPAVSHPIPNQNHFNHDPHSLPCTPTQPSNSFSFDPHQVQHYHQQQSLPPTPTDNQLQFNYQTQQQPVNSYPSYNVTAPTTAFSYPSQDSESQARSRSQPTLDPIYEEMNYSTNEEESMNDHDVNFDNFEMESLIEHFSSQEGHHHPDDQHQQHQEQPSATQAAHQQLAQTIHQSHPSGESQQTGDFSSPSLLDHSQAHSSLSSSAPDVTSKHNLNPSETNEPHNLVISDIHGRTLFPDDDLSSQALDGRSINYNLQIDYPDISHLSTHLDISTNSPSSPLSSSNANAGDNNTGSGVHRGKQLSDLNSTVSSYGDEYRNNIYNFSRNNPGKSGEKTINNNPISGSGSTSNLNLGPTSVLSTLTKATIETGVQDLMESNSCSAEPTPPPSLRSSSSNLVINLSPNNDIHHDKHINVSDEDDDDDDEDDDVFINPANISPVTSPKSKSVIKTPVSESSPKRPKHKPEPLYIPPHVNAFGQFASRLRSPRLWDPTGLHSLPAHQDTSKSSPPPYTPPPMLSPLRKGSGLYWAIINTTSSTPKANGLGTFIYARRTFSQSCEKDLGNGSLGNEQNLSTPTTAFEPEVTYDFIPVAEPDISPHVNIGPDFQANIPAYIGDRFDCDRRYRRERADKVWDPSVLDKMAHPEDIDSYLELACSGCIPGAGRNIEFALHLLHICKGDVELAISKLLNLNSLKLEPGHPMLDYPYSETEVWSKEEITDYFTALVSHDKDFHAISKKIKTKTVKECIQFYYLWKKTCPEEYRRLRSRRQKNPEPLFYSNPTPAYRFGNQNKAGNGAASAANGDTLGDDSNLSLSAFDSPMNASPSSVSSTGTSNTTGGYNGNTGIGNKATGSAKEKAMEEYPCKVCGKVFPKVKSRSAHMKVHGAGAGAAAATGMVSMRV